MNLLARLDAVIAKVDTDGYSAMYSTDMVSLLRDVRLVISLSVRSVANPAWSGVCDEDVDLEQILNKFELLQQVTNTTTTERKAMREHVEA